MLLEKNAKFDDYKKSAQVGLMTAYNEIEDHENTGKYAKLVEINTIDDKSVKYQASVLYGNSLLKSFKLDSALLAYRRTVKGTQKVMAAEAQFNIAYIYFVQQKYDESEIEISKLLQELSVYQDWASRAFILLADIYLKREDVMQAKFALNTVIANHEGQEIVNLAKKKLKELEEFEKSKLVKKEEEEFDVNIGVDSDVNGELFGEDPESEMLDSLNNDNTLPIDSTITK